MDEERWRAVQGRDAPFDGCVASPGSPDHALAGAQIPGTTPGDVRTRSRASASPTGSPDGSGTLELRLPFRAPLWPDSLFGHLAPTAVPGVEEWRDRAYRRPPARPGRGPCAARPGHALGALPLVRRAHPWAVGDHGVHLPTTHRT